VWIIIQMNTWRGSCAVLWSSLFRFLLSSIFSMSSSWYLWILSFVSSTHAVHQAVPQFHLPASQPGDPFSRHKMGTYGAHLKCFTKMLFAWNPVSWNHCTVYFAYF
jgi:hypothetical protein